MVHVNETIIIKSSSPKLAEWVKKLKAHKAEQLDKLHHIEKLFRIIYLLTLNCSIHNNNWYFCLATYP